MAPGAPLASGFSFAFGFGFGLGFAGPELRGPV